MDVDGASVVSDRFGPYDVHECVGSGGMATVHRATIALGGGVMREVALKRLLPHLAEDDRFVDDFVREAKLAVHLRHPNIIQIYDLGRIGNDFFIAMELVRGVSLMSLMRFASKTGRLLPIGAVLSLALELADALDHAHTGTTERGEPLELVHRDLTPSNLLITDDGHLKIIDFGIAKATRGDLATDSGLAKGKAGYMAPEAVRGEQVDPRADLFSVGVVLWELLTGQRLFRASTEWGEPTVLRDTPVGRPSMFNPGCPPELDQIVLHAVAKQRDQRWRSADELHRALTTVARGVPATAAEVMRAKQALRPETVTDPYAGFAVCDVIDDDLPEIVISQTPRPLDWTGSLWPLEPATEPKLMQRVEGTSSWPIEPATEPKLKPMDPFHSEPPSIQISELPVEFAPISFETEAPVMLGAPRHADTMKTDQVPTVIPDEPAKTRPSRASTEPSKAKAKRPPPFREARATERKSAPGAAVDRVDRPDTQPVLVLQVAEPTAEGRAFATEIDTLSESDPFDDE